MCFQAYSTVVAGGTCPTPGNSVRFTVRSADDPYILAGQKTEFTYDFGNTQAENAVTGTKFVVLGVIFSIVPACGIYLLLDAIKKRNAQNANGQPQVVAHGGLAGSRFGGNDGYGPNAGGSMQQMQMQPGAQMGYGQPMAQPMQGYPMQAQPIMAQPVSSFGLTDTVSQRFARSCLISPKEIDPFTLLFPGLV